MTNPRMTKPVLDSIEKTIEAIEITSERALSDPQKNLIRSMGSLCYSHGRLDAIEEGQRERNQHSGIFHSITGGV